MAPFQVEAFDAIAPSLHALQNRRKPRIRRFWWERTKGTSKDCDAAIVLIWLMAFAKYPLYAQVGAADREQAGIVKRRAEVLLFENPWLRKYIEVQGKQIKGRESAAKTDILAADVTGGAHGEAPEFLLLNELSHVQRWQFIKDLMANAQKVPMGIVLAATNAGFTGTEAEKWKKIANSSAKDAGLWMPEGKLRDKGRVKTKAHSGKRRNGASQWWYQVVNYPAPWISKEDLADEQLRDPGTRFDRLWWGVWTDGKGDALNRAMIERAITLDGPARARDKHLVYVGGLDLGVSNDHAGVVVLGFDTELQRASLVFCRDFPVVDLGTVNEVDLIAVKECVRALHERFDISWFGYDPHQAALMAQELRAESDVPMQKVPFTGKSLDRMATLLVDAFKSRKISIYEDDHLLTDLKKLTLTEKPYGYKLDATRDATGHADVATSLVIALLGAFGDDDLLEDFDEDLTCSSEDTREPMTDQEVNELDDDLREIVEDARKGYGGYGGRDDWDWG